MRYTPQLLQPLSVASKNPPKKSSWSMDNHASSDELDDYVGYSVDSPEESLIDWKKIWSQVTERGEVGFSDDAQQAMEQALDSWRDQPEYRVETLVRSACYLPPIKEDEEDITRLVSVFTHEEQRELATKESSDPSALPYLYPDIPDLFDFYDVIASECGIDSDSNYDVWALTKFTRKEMKNAITALKESGQEITPASINNAISGNNENIFPSTSEGNRAKYVKKTNKHDATQARTLDEVSVLVSCDLQAKDMIEQHYPVSEVLEHHSKVPAGYWDRVNEEIVKGTGDLMDIYDLLEDEFRFHAEDRDIPTRS